MKKIIIILQSRSSSKRLPGKALRKINKIPIVMLCIKRLTNKNHKLIVATSKNKSDDKLVNFLIDNKISYYRGSLNNVLSRYVELAKNLNPSDLIVRATADNIFPDGHLVNFLKNKIKKLNMDYIGIDHKLHFLPKGVGLEIFTAKKIINTSKLKLKKKHLEHVTLKIYKNKNKYKNIFFKKLKQSKDLSNIRVTIDTRKDYLFMKKFLKKIDNLYQVPYYKLIELLKNNFL